MESSSSQTLAPRRREQKSSRAAAWGAMLAGSALAIYGWTRKSASGAALGVAGGAIALKAASAGPLADVLGTEMTARRSVTVNRSAADLYSFWKDVSQAPRWMEHIESVTQLGDGRSRWKRPHPGTGTLEWTSEITEDVPNKSLGWRTVATSDSDYEFGGRVEFREIGFNRGTEVELSLRYKMHAGLLHSGAAMLIGQSPEQEMRENLRHFKMLMEAGEIATIRGQSHGPRKAKAKIMELFLGEQARKGKTA
jgi:uncharacterized membrane protein